jgi:imidazolonepropionase-like amidohydrolase
MTAKPLCSVILSVALTASALAADPPSTTLYVRCGKFLSRAGDRLQGAMTMIVRDGKIVAVGASLPIPVGAQQLDLSRYTVVAGFIDSHIHLWTGPFTPGTSPSYGLQALRAY